MEHRGIGSGPGRGHGPGSNRIWALVCGAVGAALVIAAERAWDYYQGVVVVRGVVVGISDDDDNITGPPQVGPLFAVAQDRQCDWCDDIIFEDSLAGFVNGRLYCEDCYDGVTEGLEEGE